MDQFKNSIKKQINTVSTTTYTIPILIVMGYIQGLTIIDLMPFVLFYLFFPLLLYVNYLYYSVKVKISVNIIDEKLTYENKVNKCEIYFSEIVAVKKVCSTPEGENRIKWLSTDGFYYHLIELTNGEKLVFTCFVIDKLDFILKEIEVKKRTIAFIY